MKKRVALDFDGVLHRYSGWNGGRIDRPLAHSQKVVAELIHAGLEPFVFTTRDVQVVQKFLEQYQFPVMEVTNEKLPCHVIVDDRAICFTGGWTPELVHEIIHFKTYWEKWTETPTEPLVPVKLTRDQLNRLIDLAAPSHDLQQLLRNQLNAFLNK